MAEDLDAEFALFENEISALEAAGEVLSARYPSRTTTTKHGHMQIFHAANDECARLSHANVTALKSNIEPEYRSSALERGKCFDHLALTGSREMRKMRPPRQAVGKPTRLPPKVCYAFLAPPSSSYALLSRPDVCVKRIERPRSGFQKGR